jgi:subtilisin-like proprotein convertase family protein
MEHESSINNSTVRHLYLDMLKSFYYTLAVLIFCGFSQLMVAQSTTWWSPLGKQAPSLLRSQQENIAAREAYYISSDLPLLHRILDANKDRQIEIVLPDPTGTNWTFLLESYSMMEAPLQAKYPNIRTYRGQAVGVEGFQIHLTSTATAWFASISNGSTSWYIDPQARPYGDFYQIYYKKDCQEEQNLLCKANLSDRSPETTLRNANEKIEGQIRTYRLAVSASYDYTAFFGGSKEGAMAGIVNTVNRVNMIYERDLAVRMILIANNDSLIITDSNNDQFSNDGLEGIENQRFIDDEIGSDNYDVGHIFGVTGGGYADLGGVCDDDIKAKAYTGLPRPQGDPFDIDFVAHEMGHQFGANHTFNGIGGSCGVQRYPFTSFEPGAGTTVMAYAGICGLDNITPNSDDYFHGGSIVEMNRFLVNGRGRTCMEPITSNNTAPTIELDTDLKFIPILTPFELNAKVQDAENLTLDYCWEQIDTGNGASLGSYGDDDGPLFRSFPPERVAYRSFPRMEDLLDNRFLATELLPNTNRELNFQLTVRDNNDTGPGIAWDQVKYFVQSEAGPFRVDNPRTIIAGSNYAFRWDVAKTNEFPVSVDSVDLYLSTDGGLNFNAPLGRFLNDGFAVPFIPTGIESNSVRFKLKAVDNIFFDITDRNSIIRPALANENTIDLIGELEELAFCAVDSIRLPFYYNVFSSQDSFQVAINANLSGFGGLIEIVEQSRFDLVLTGGTSLATGLYPVQVFVSTGDQSDTLDFEVSLLGANVILNLNLKAPAEGLQDVAIQPLFTWEGDELADLYQVEVARDSTFQEILYSSGLQAATSWQLPETLLAQERYFWRVEAINERCGQTTVSEMRQFNTENIVCQIFTPTDLPIAFNNFPFIQSNITIAEDVIVRDVNLLNITGTYDLPGGINFRLRSPNGPILELVPRQVNCSIGEEFNFSLDDDGGQSFLPCPNNQGVTLLPQDALSTYNGQEAAGRWTLSIFDNGGNGTLEDWSLELCFGASSVVNTATELAGISPQLQVFPNPMQDLVQFKTKQSIIQSIAIFDAAGRTVQSISNLSTSEIAMKVSDLGPGVYFYQVILKRGDRLTGKLIK